MVSWLLNRIHETFYSITLMLTKKQISSLVDYSEILKVKAVPY